MSHFNRAGTCRKLALQTSLVARWTELFLFEPSRRAFRSSLFALIILACGMVVGDQPNVLLIISDDQAWTDYGFMGHSHVKTPNLDQLARQSILFKRGYVPTALCRPSLMTIVTGRYAHDHGVTGNDPFGDSSSPDNEGDLREALISKIDRLETLPKLLDKAGYLSFQSGKWWEGNFKRGGFTHGMTRGYPQKGAGMAMMVSGSAEMDWLKLKPSSIRPSLRKTLFCLVRTFSATHTTQST